jgi:hypothetical protein
MWDSYGETRTWYSQCTDRCSECFHLPFIRKYETEYSFCCDCGPRSQVEGPKAKNIALAICEWNKVQRKKRKKL